jgi:class 3 adenylate cyclase
MGLLDDLKEEVRGIFAEQWNIAEGNVVPDPEDLRLSNDARHFERATVLYADLSGSTKLVDGHSWMMAGEIYKAYLACAARIIRSLDGEITSYDGDRIMAVFISNFQTSNAVKCGLQINWAVRNIVNPALKRQYPAQDYTVKQVVGIDTGEIRSARIGVRGGNDLVWIGRAANYAAKLTECRNDHQTWITQNGYNKLADWAKNGGNPKQSMWKEFNWTQMNNIRVYGSDWTWSIT